MTKPDKKNGSPKGNKQPGHGNNRNQPNTRRHGTQSQQQELFETSDSGRKQKATFMTRAD